MFFASSEFLQTLPIDSQILQDLRGHVVLVLSLGQVALLHDDLVLLGFAILAP